MKPLFFVLAFCASISLLGQENYKVDGKLYSLKTEVEGKLTLLWNVIDGEYRYFSKKGEDIQELTNTKIGGTYQKEYKETLLAHTPDYSTLVDPKIDLTLPSLRRFFIDYNRASDPNFSIVEPIIQLKTRLGVFAGMSNYIYFVNPENSLLPQIGVDFEIIDDAKLRRHSIVFQFRQLLATSTLDLSSSQFSVNHRFKFIQSETLDVYINTKVASYAYLSQNIDVPNNNGTIETISGSGGEFQAPFAFGVGADIALGKGYLSLGYQDIVALNLEDNGDFAMDFVLGYKFNL